MNGFRYELVNRILGINSHLTIQKPESAINDYENLVEKNQLQPQAVRTINICQQLEGGSLNIPSANQLENLVSLYFY